MQVWQDVGYLIFQHMIGTVVEQKLVSLLVFMTRELNLGTQPALVRGISLRLKY